MLISSCTNLLLNNLRFKNNDNFAQENKKRKENCKLYFEVWLEFLTIIIFLPYLMLLLWFKINNAILSRQFVLSFIANVYVYKQ